VALAFILLVGSALTVRTVTKLLHQEAGFRTDHLLTFDLPEVGVDLESEPTEKRIAEDRERLERVFAQIARVPGVLAVTAASHDVLGGTSMMMSGFQVQGALPERPDSERQAIARYVDPSYFATLGIPLARGRDFTPRVGDKMPSEIIVNEAMAKEYWGTLDVIGKHVSCSQTSDGKPVWSDVVGVVANARETSISQAPQPAYYLSMLQTTNGHQQVFVRTQNDPSALAATITKQLWALFPDQPVSDVTTITQVITKSVGSQRLRSILLTVFALVGFALALVGTYGVISFSVSRRVQEIGVRMAVGARSTDVLCMILLQGLLLVTLGVAIGAAAASGLARLISSQLYGVQPGDPLTFLGAGALVLMTAAIACLLPARRAMKVDPIIALRYE
jgi:putative ABC transport system permease protein